jgi:hypothetical protein
LAATRKKAADISHRAEKNAIEEHSLEHAVRHPRGHGCGREGDAKQHLHNRDAEHGPR